MKRGMLLLVFLISVSLVYAAGDCTITSGACSDNFVSVDDIYFYSFINSHVCYDSWPSNPFECEDFYDYDLCCPRELATHYETSWGGAYSKRVYLAPSEVYNGHVEVTSEENYGYFGGSYHYLMFTFRTDTYPTDYVDFGVAYVTSTDSDPMDRNPSDGTTKCYYNPGGCLSDDICIFGLSGDTNAHVADCSHISPYSYPTAVCCPQAPDCGDGIIEGEEECDGSDDPCDPGYYCIGCNCAPESEETHLECIGGTCQDVSGGGPDLDGCTQIGDSCVAEGDCDLTNAYWEVDGSDDVVPEGREVTLTVDGNTYCVGDVTFDIAEVDCVIGCDYDDIDQEDTDELNVKQVTATFSGGDAVATWTAEWVQDDGGWDDDPEYYFKATWSPDFRADSDELKVEAGVCGDGLVNQDLEECDIDDLGEEEDCESYLGTNWEGLLGCYEAGDDNECEYNIDQCDDDDSNPDDPEGTFRQWGECIDDGDGDNIGTREVYLYSSETGMQVCGWGGADDCVFAIEECLLGEEEIPFFSYLAFMVFLFILGAFYSNEIFKKKENINKNNKEVN